MNTDVCDSAPIAAPLVIERIKQTASSTRWGGFNHPPSPSTVRRVIGTWVAVVLLSCAQPRFVFIKMGHINQQGWPEYVCGYNGRVARFTANPANTMMLRPDIALGLADDLNDNNIPGGAEVLPDTALVREFHDFRIRQQFHSGGVHGRAVDSMFDQYGKWMLVVPTGETEGVWLKVSWSKGA